VRDVADRQMTSTVKTDRYQVVDRQQAADKRQTASPLQAVDMLTDRVRKQTGRAAVRKVVGGIKIDDRYVAGGRQTGNKIQTVVGQAKRERQASKQIIGSGLKSIGSLTHFIHINCWNAN